MVLSARVVHLSICAAPKSAFGVHCLRREVVTPFLAYFDSLVSSEPVSYSQKCPIHRFAIRAPFLMRSYVKLVKFPPSSAENFLRGMFSSVIAPKQHTPGISTASSFKDPNCPYHLLCTIGTLREDGWWLRWLTAM